MELLYNLLENPSMSILAAFLLGLFVTISPCTLATNISAIAFISKDLKGVKHLLANSLYYTLGRAITYTIIAIIIYVGAIQINIGMVLQNWGDKILGPLFILIALFMLDIIHFEGLQNLKVTDKVQNFFKDRGYLGSLALGLLFALAFCPYSGVMYFGLLIPLIFTTQSPVITPLIFSIGTAIPVIVFSIVLAVSLDKMANLFSSIQKFEKILRKTVAIIFLGIGIYYLKFLFLYIMSLS